MADIRVHNGNATIGLDRRQSHHLPSYPPSQGTAVPFSWRDSGTKVWDLPSISTTLMIPWNSFSVGFSPSDFISFPSSLVGIKPLCLCQWDVEKRRNILHERGRHKNGSNYNDDSDEKKSIYCEHSFTEKKGTTFPFFYGNFGNLKWKRPITTLELFICLSVPANTYLPQSEGKMLKCPLHLKKIISVCAKNYSSAYCINTLPNFSFFKCDLVFGSLRERLRLLTVAS